MAAGALQFVVLHAAAAKRQARADPERGAAAAKDGRCPGPAACNSKIVSIIINGGFSFINGAYWRGS